MALHLGTLRENYEKLTDSICIDDKGVIFSELLTRGNIDKKQRMKHFSRYALMWWNWLNIATVSCLPSVKCWRRIFIRPIFILKPTTPGHCWLITNCIKLPDPLCQLRQNPINKHHVVAFNVLVSKGIILHALQISIAISVPDTADISLRNAGIIVGTQVLRADHDRELSGVYKLRKWKLYLGKHT